MKSVFFIDMEVVFTYLENVFFIDMEVAWKNVFYMYIYVAFIEMKVAFPASARQGKRQKSLL